MSASACYSPYIILPQIPPLGRLPRLCISVLLAGQSSSKNPVTSFVETHTNNSS
jgi:hypothetical protein